MSTLMKIGFGSNSIVMAEGVVTPVDPIVTLWPRGPDRPFVRDWRIVEHRGERRIELDTRWIPNPRGAA